MVYSTVSLKNRKKIVEDEVLPYLNPFFSWTILWVTEGPLDSSLPAFALFDYLVNGQVTQFLRRKEPNLLEVSLWSADRVILVHLDRSKLSPESFEAHSLQVKNIFDHLVVEGEKKFVEFFQ